MTRDTVLNSPNKRFEEIKKIDEDGVEYWEARELMLLLGYLKWENFEKVVIKRSKDACKKSRQSVKYHFADIGKMVIIGKGSVRQAERKVKDYKLSRYACYLIAQNGDPMKVEVATAQTYFAIQTRKHEIFQSLSEVEQRLFLRGKVKVHNRELQETAHNAGVRNFGKFNNAGYLGLYGMNKTSVQKKKEIGEDDVLDRAGATELAANLFRVTQTDDKIKREKIKGEGKATFTHIIVGQKVRKTIKDIGGIMPEDLPVEESIKKLKIRNRKILDQ